MKVVQGIISELESQGALPRSNSRVSSLATCCGPRLLLMWLKLILAAIDDVICNCGVSYFDCRFVELLWQLSLHALREVHRRTFPADVASNPLPSSLTDVSFSHAATLLPVTKVAPILFLFKIVFSMWTRLSSNERNNLQMLVFMFAGTDSA